MTLYILKCILCVVYIILGIKAIVGIQVNTKGTVETRQVGPQAVNVILKGKDTPHQKTEE